MDGHGARLGEVAPPDGDRFAAWPATTGRLALALLALLMLLAAVAPGYGPPPPAPPKIAVAQPHGGAGTHLEYDNDMLLYRVINARLRQGESYYRVATEEQRARGYPVAPAVTVRLPTLALLAATLGDRAMVVLGIALFAGMLLAMQRRLAAEPGGALTTPLALGMLTLGAACGLNYRFNVLHEIWAGQLIALSLALHRGGLDSRDGSAERWADWGWAWLAAALALAVRELALPYVLAMAALAVQGGRQREGAAWLVLIGLFGLALLVHLHLAGAWIQPGDAQSASWVSLEGLAGLLYKLNHSTYLSLLPLWLSGPLAILALFGWAARDTPLGRSGLLLAGGYALGFMLFGRDNNFYWGLMIAPVLFMGLAFAPAGLCSLVKRAALSGNKAAAAHA